MMRPAEPNKEDCCNSGCNPCIFDVYEKQLRLYENIKDQNEESMCQTENGISQLEYTIFFVTDIVSICKRHKLIIFKRLENDRAEPKIFWNPGDHFLLKYSSGDSSCTRAYTPIKLKKNSTGSFDFSIIIKLYDSGLVSNYLFSLEKGDKTLWRGPYGFYEIIPNKYSRIIMLSQGTGIAPLISIIDSVLNNEDDMTKLFLFYCCSSDDLILFRDELYTYKSFWNFTYKIYLSSARKYVKYKYLEPINNRKLTPEDLLDLQPFSYNDQFLLCGSAKFINQYDIYLQNKGVLSNNMVLF